MDTETRARLHQIEERFRERLSTPHTLSACKSMECENDMKFLLNLVKELTR